MMVHCEVTERAMSSLNKWIDLESMFSSATAKHNNKLAATFKLLG